MSNSWYVISLVDGRTEQPLKGRFKTKEEGADKLLERLNVQYELLKCERRIGEYGMSETYEIRRRGATSSSPENVFGYVMRMNACEIFHAALESCGNALYRPDRMRERSHHTECLMGVEYVQDLSWLNGAAPQINGIFFLDGCMSKDASFENRPQAIVAAATLTEFAREQGNCPPDGGYVAAEWYREYRSDSYFARPHDPSRVDAALLERWRKAIREF